MRCPLCDGLNACARAGGSAPGPGGCWCDSVSIAPDILDRIPPHLQGRCCLCPECAIGHVGAPEIDGETTTADTYLTADGRLVFTRAYHLRRGACCGSGCRHCPYRGR